MTLRLLLFFIVLASLQGCFGKSEVKSETKETYAQPQSVVDNGILKMHDSNGTYILADDAIDYHVISSPQDSWLAVETLLFSNLQIIRVYKKETDGRYKPLKKPVAVKIWAELSKKEAFSTEDVRYPRMNFLHWVDENTMLINISGQTDDKEIDRNITFLLN